MLTKIPSLVSELGWFDALLYGFNRLVAKRGLREPFFRYELVAQPVADGPMLPVRRGRSIQVRRLGEGDSALAELPLSPGVLRHRFRQGALCFGAFKEGEVIGCLWLALGPYDEDEVRARFVPEPADRTAWDFDVYLTPEERGGFGFMRLWDEANAYMRERGIRWTMSRISAFNAGSLASHGRLSARLLARALFVRIGGVQVAFASVRPRIHVSLGRTSAPVYPLQAPDSD